MSFERIAFLTILIAALALFINGRLRIDVVAVLVLLALAATGVLTPAEALSGFASEPMIIVAAVFVLAAALGATGVTDRIGHWIGRAAGRSEWRALLVIMPAVATLAAFSHHVMITAMMLPIIMRFAREHQLPASRLLMPMSLSASLGTTLTLFSAPAFLLADDLLQRQTGTGLGIFDITPIGVALVFAGVAYVMVMRWLLPRRSGEATEQDYLRLERYFTELVVESASPWTGRSVADFETRFAGRLQLVERLRHGGPVTDGADSLQPGDLLLVRASPDEISSAGHNPGLALNATAKYGDVARVRGRRGATRLVQVVVDPASEFIGRSVGEVDFLQSFGVLVVGIWRRDDWIDQEISAIQLREGDLLVLSGTDEHYAALAQHRGFLMMVPFNARQTWRHRAPLAIGIMASVVVAAASGLFSPPLVFLAGAVAMVLTRCVSLEQAYSEIDVRIVVMIAGVIPLGAAMEKTGTAALLAAPLLAHGAEFSPLLILLCCFAAAAMLTQVLSDAATLVLLGPIAIAIALGLGLPPAPFVVVTALGAVASFLTPIGHHGNLLILGPGRYTFGDFLRVGLPLTALIAAISCWMARAMWLDGPWLPSALLQWLHGVAG
jgi:di/tricarboxylate transporter